MSKESMVLRDLISSCYITGTTISALNLNQTNTTDLFRAAITEGTTDTPWSQTAYTYDISGYTVEQSVEGATAYPFYVNTGATLTTLASGVTGDTLLSTYISGSTVVPSGITVTEIPVVTTGITSTTANSLNVSINGGSPTFTNLFVTGNLTVSGTTYEVDQYVTDELYIGPKDQTNSWRFVISNQNLLIQVFDGLNWLTKGTFFYV